MIMVFRQSMYSETPNKGHIGSNINSAILSFIERLSSLRSFLCIETIGESIFADHRQCPLYNRGLIYSVPSSEGPLSEVQLYIILGLQGKQGG